MAANAGGHWVSPTLRRLGDGIRAIERPRAISGQIGGRPRTISDWLGRPRAFSAGPQNVTGQNLAFCHPLSSTASVSAGGPRVGPAAGRSAARGRPRARHGPGAASDRGRARKNAKWMENRPSGVVILQKKAAGLRPAASFFFRFIYLLAMKSSPHLRHAEQVADF